MIRIRYLVLLIIFANLLIFNQSVSAKNSIQIKGSDTEINLVQRLAEQFMKKNPKVRIAVTGGGSGTGIAALLNSRVDIASSSREMTRAELKKAEEKGLDPRGIVVSLDALSIITHIDNPVHSLTLDQVGQIFRGEITDWQELGAPPGKISMYGRQSNSGTFIYFREVVLKGDYFPQVKRMNGNAQIVEAVKRDKASIGYVGVGYVIEREGKVIPGLRIIELSRERGAPTVSPAKFENVRGRIYPLVRPLYQYVNGQPKGDVLRFLEFELSPEGQEIVQSEGFFPIAPQQMVHNNKMLGLR